MKEADATEIPHIAIVGAGFGGLNAAKTLGGKRVRVTLVDRRNHHLFQPLLYQVATAGLNPSDIAVPTRSILRRKKNVTVYLAEVTGIDRQARRLILRDGGLSYDYLILATGATHSYFGHDDWERWAPGLKSLEDALEMRRRILTAFEAAERESDPVQRNEWLSFVVIGGGATGVELAGTLVEIARHTLTRDFRRIDPRDARVILIEGLPRVLPTYPESLSAKAREQLEELGVSVRTGARVTGVDEGGVTLEQERVAARTVLWAAGVEASSVAKSLGAPLDRAGRVLVTTHLTIPGDERVFVIGDLAALEQEGKMIPGVAPAAMQEGRYAAKSILRALSGQPPVPFRYVDKGSLATIGRAAAVADIRGLHLSGFIAWFAWLAIHIFFLIGFRNRVFVIIQWAMAYLSHSRGARLITGGPRFSEEHAESSRSAPASRT